MLRCSMKVIQCSPTMAKEVGKFYDEVTLYLTNHTNFPKWRYRSYPSEQSALQASQSGTQFACVENGRIIGAFVLNTDPQGNYDAVKWGKEVEQGNYLVIHSFATHPTLYRKGVGSVMLDFCLQQAQQRKMQAVRLDVVPTNYPARNFYLKHGFTFVGEADLNRNFDDIPTFCLYELNLDR